MQVNPCIKALKSAIGDKANVTDEQIAQIVSEVEARVRLRGDAANINGIEDAIFQATRDVVGDLRTSALLEQRKAALNLIRREGLHQRLSQFGNPVEGLKATLVGIQKGVPDARRSVDATFHATRTAYQGGMLADLRKGGLLEVFNSRAIDREIARELWEIRPDGTPGISKSKEAQEIAGIIAKWQRAALERLNRSGAYIKELTGYITRQSHDYGKLSRAGFEEWFDFTAGKLDLERTFGKTEDLRAAAKETYWTLLKGKHLEIPEDQLISLKGGDVGRKVSAHRELHFKDADAWFDYNQKFGGKHLGESVFGGLEHAARNISLMETFGPEPEAMFKTVLQDLMDKAADTKTVDELRKVMAGGGMLSNYFKEVSGELMRPGSNVLARVGRGWRTLNSLSKLGMVMISSVADLATKASELKFQGVGFLESWGRTLADVVAGRGSGWRREFADILGAGFEGTLGDVHGRFTSEDDMPGAMTKAMNLFFKWNGLNWFTDANKTGLMLALSHNLARNDKEFAVLPRELSRGLSMYAIDAPKWEALRKVINLGEDGRHYMDPSLIATLPDEVVKEAFSLPKAGQRRIRQLKDELETGLRSYLVDRVDHGVLTPGAAENALLHLGTQAGTPAGEALRMLMQFKAFPITGLTRGLGRLVYANGADTFMQAIFKGKADYMGLAHMIVATTTLGYLAMSAKDILKGKTPRDPNSPRTWISSMMQGGGLGIMGDFAFGEFNRFGSSALSSLTGPAAGQVESVAELYAKAREGEDFAANAFKLAVNNTPFINLYYTRPVLDYLVLYRVQEAMNPGFLRRMERRVEKENHQTYILPPSKYATR